MVLICIVCLLALCIAPWVDPPETVLKSLQVIFLLMSALVAGLHMLADTLPVPSRPLGMKSTNIPPIPDLLLPSETSCVQQC